MVRASYEKTKNITLDKAQLVECYHIFGCEGVVALINMLFSDKRGLCEIGSSSLDFAGVTQGPFSLENAISLSSIYIGNRRKGVTPTKWLSHLSLAFGTLSLVQRDAFDVICQDIVNMENAIKDL